MEAQWEYAIYGRAQNEGRKMKGARYHTRWGRGARYPALDLVGNREYLLGVFEQVARVQDILLLILWVMLFIAFVIHCLAFVGRRVYGRYRLNLRIIHYESLFGQFFHYRRQGRYQHLLQWIIYGR